MEWLVEVLIRRMLQSRPVVRNVGSSLVISSPFKAQVLCLGFAGRKVVVDPTRKLVRIARRFLWFASASEVYTFNRILNVDFGYSDWSLSDLSPFGAYQDRGLFTVSLQLVTGQKVPLFRFYSEGDFMNTGWIPDIFLLDDYIEAAVTKGSQITAADALASAVAGVIGVRVQNN